MVEAEIAALRAALEDLRRSGVVPRAFKPTEEVDFTASLDSKEAMLFRDELRRQLYVSLISHARFLSPSVADQAALAVSLGQSFVASAGRDETVDSATIPALSREQTGVASCDLAVWQGDICTLRVDAVTNAANGGLLGCFQPFHKCIDNALHAVAGPWLRSACQALRCQGVDAVTEDDVRAFATKEGAGLVMGALPPTFDEQLEQFEAGSSGTNRLEGQTAGALLSRSFDEPPGRARATPAYLLPSRFVIHTVGPIVRTRRPSREDEALLRSCYRSVLDKCRDVGARSVALCGISTGVFGYPEDEGAEVALRTVKEWLLTGNNAESMDLVIFNTFTNSSHEIYSSLVETVFSDSEDAVVTIDEEEEYSLLQFPATAALPARIQSLISSSPSVFSLSRTDTELSVAAARALLENDDGELDVGEELTGREHGYFAVRVVNARDLATKRVVIADVLACLIAAGVELFALPDAVLVKDTSLPAAINALRRNSSFSFSLAA